jgi:hypothetical protein
MSMRKKIFFWLVMVFGMKSSLSQTNCFRDETIELNNFLNGRSVFGVENNKGDQSGRGNIFYRLPEENNSHFWDKLFIKLYGGQGFFTPGSYNVSSVNEISWITLPFNLHDTTIKTQSKKGIGGGLRLGGGVGFILNDFLNLGIDVDFNKGNKLNNTLITFINQENYSRATDAMNYSAVTLTPHIVFKALARPKFFIYNKIGLLLTLPFTLRTYGNSATSSSVRIGPNYIRLDSLICTNCYLTNISTDSSSYGNKYKISLGIGLHVAFGINWKLTDRLRVFAEVFGNYSALTPSTAAATTFDKYASATVVDSTNFHYEQKPVRTITQTLSYTKYERNGGVSINSYVNQDFGNNSEGYDQKIVTAIGNSHKFTINMAVLGVSMGIIWRF